MISLVFGMAHLSQKNSDADFMSRFVVLIWSAITGAVIYLVVRDAKRLGDAVGSSQITSPRGNK